MLLTYLFLFFCLVFFYIFFLVCLSCILFRDKIESRKAFCSSVNYYCPLLNIQNSSKCSFSGEHYPPVSTSGAQNAASKWGTRKCNNSTLKTTKERCNKQLRNALKKLISTPVQLRAAFFITSPLTDAHVSSPLLMKREAISIKLKEPEKVAHFQSWRFFISSG